MTGDPIMTNLGARFADIFGAPPPRPPFSVCASFDLDGAGVSEYAGTFPTLAKAREAALRISESGFRTDLIDRDTDPDDGVREAEATVHDATGRLVFDAVTYNASLEAHES